jgi:IS605 OrfB family transposase
MNNILLKRKNIIDKIILIKDKYSKNLPLKIYDKKINYDTDSWFSAEKIKTEKTVNTISYTKKFPDTVISSQKIKIIFNIHQKEIINSWFNAHTKMYNVTLKYIYKNYPMIRNTTLLSKFLLENKIYSGSSNKIEFTNFIYLRKQLLTEKKEIQNDSQLKISTNTKIYIHVLDYAIKQVCSNLKSAISNFINGHIKRFRIKLWKFNRISKSLDIEPRNIKNNNLFTKILGITKYKYNNKFYNLPKINTNTIINYNRITNEYYLLIPKENKSTELNNKKKNIIVLDPGLRTFMTGLSNNNAVKIGINVNSIIAKKIETLNKIKNNINISNKIKKKNRILINQKIKNKIDDLHWKTISFLTTNYNNILLGDMSAKSIVRKTSSILSPNMKTACLRTGYYKFQQRLAYKCNLTKTNFSLVNEMYTSKICSNCCNYNEKLSKEKIYDCVNCKLTIDRDINACRNIFFKSLI